MCYQHISYPKRNEANHTRCGVLSKIRRWDERSMRRSGRPRLSHGFQKHGARKDQAHRYRVVTRGSPPSICRNRGKKGPRSGGGRRMSVAPSLVGAYQRIRGAIQGYICRRSYFHHQSLSWLTSAPRVCFVRTDRLGESTTSLHPPKIHDRDPAPLDHGSLLSHGREPFSRFHPVLASEALS